MLIRSLAAFCCFALVATGHVSAQVNARVSAPATPPSLQFDGSGENTGSDENTARGKNLVAKTTSPKAKQARPQFQNRVWHNTVGQPIANGKAMGISKDVIWLRTARGAVVRKKLAELHPQDRQHAIKKRQAILDYRQHTKQVSS